MVRATTLRTHAIAFAAILLLGNASVGERGLVETLRARRVCAAAVADVARIRAENAHLRDEARRLRSDPATIEAVARRDLGLVRPGEIVVKMKGSLRQ